MRTLTHYLQPARARTMARIFLSLLMLLLTCVAYAQSAPRSFWVKLCDNGTLIQKDKDGKEQRKGLDGCVTLQERLDANSGRVLVGAYLYQCRFDGQEKQLFKVMVPTGIAIQAGMRVTLVPKTLWEKILRNEELEKSEAARLGALTFMLSFMPCRPDGCAAELEATSDLLTALKSGGGLIVGVISESGTSITPRLALDGFAQAFEGEPSRESKPHLRTQLMQELFRCAKGPRRP